MLTSSILPRGVLHAGSRQTKVCSLDDNMLYPNKGTPHVKKIQMTPIYQLQSELRSHSNLPGYFILENKVFKLEFIGTENDQCYKLSIKFTLVRPILLITTAKCIQDVSNASANFHLGASRMNCRSGTKDRGNSERQVVLMVFQEG
jgi:hypothetical protein